MIGMGALVRRFLRRPAAVIGLSLFVLLALFAFFGGSLWKHSFKSTEFSRLAAPSRDHPFGTELLGADTLAQVIRGIRTSMIDVAHRFCSWSRGTSLP
jgi:peptide/nickel transport system permease protein